MFRVSKSYPPHKQVIKDISLSFFLGAKIGIIGLNGSGKSTLLKIIGGIEKEFQGEVVFSPGYTVGHLPQDPLMDERRTVREIVEEGAADVVAVLKEYEEINLRFGEPEVYENPCGHGEADDPSGTASGEDRGTRRMEPRAPA
ncbi:MAG: ATP-binding cassette domain-containing protein [Marinilabiliales bacterium]|nr:ATP-binding cassette domain-containing protein [Marinilabiliales bacterium]